MNLKHVKATQQLIVLVLLAVVLVVFTLFLPGFADPANLLTLVQNVSILGILGLGMAVVVIGRGIDISIVASLAVPAGLVLQMVQDGHSVGISLLAAFALALAFGLLNGWLIAYVEISALFTTLASGLFLAGLGQAGFFQIDVVLWPKELDPLKWIGRGNVLGIPMPVVMFAFVALLVWFLLQKTRVGTFIYALGDNPFGARATGIPTRPVILTQYVLSALIGLIAGLVMAASISSVPTRIYNGTMVYDVILVVVLGGIGLTGGRGGIGNVIVGTLMIGTILNGMTILDLSYSAQNIVKGCLLLLALIVDSAMNPRNEETAQQGDI